MDKSEKVTDRRRAYCAPMLRRGQVLAAVTSRVSPAEEIVEDG